MALWRLAENESVQQRMGSVVVALLLRALTLASKLLLMLALARWLSPADIGQYGLLVAAASIGMTVAGLELYSITTREIVKSSPTRKAQILRDQFVAYPIVHTLIGLGGLAVYAAGLAGLPFVAAVWLLIVVENVSQECFRMLIVFGRPVLANWVLFLRTGAWAYVVIAVFWRFEEWRTLGCVVALWIAFGAASIGLALWYARELPWHAIRGVRIDWSWLRASILSAWPFMLSAALGLMLTYGDRYILTGYVDRNSLGVFTLYSTLAIAISSLASTAVSQHFLPHVIAAHQASLLEFRGSLRRFAGANLVFVTAIVAIALPAIHVVVYVIGNPVYAGDLGAYYALMIAAGLRSLADVPSYALYAGHQDRALLVSNFAAAIVSVGGNLLLIPPLGIRGAAIAALLTATVAYVLQVLFAIRLMRMIHAANRND